MDIKVLAYADDITIVGRSRNQDLQSNFDEYEKLSILSGLELNANKTEVLILIPSAIDGSQVRYHNFEIGRVTQLKICGIWVS